MSPEFQRARQAGVSAIVECTPIGVGRRADILKAVSEASEVVLPKLKEVGVDEATIEKLTVDNPCRAFAR